MSKNEHTERYDEISCHRSDNEKDKRLWHSTHYSKLIDKAVAPHHHKVRYRHPKNTWLLLWLYRVGRNMEEGGRKTPSHTLYNSGKLHLTVFCTIPRNALIDTEFHFYTRNTTKRQQTLRNN